MEDYRVELDSYSGPLDILLYLIRKAEIDVFEVTISQIIQQYLKYIHKHIKVDVNSIGDFLILATSLLEIKSKLVLPREELDLEETFKDPRFNLVQELLEYRRFKNLGYFLEAKEAEEIMKFQSCPPELPADEREITAILGQVLNDIDIWDLFNAYDRINDEVAPPPLEYTEVPIEEIIIHIEALVREKKKIEIIAFLKTQQDKGWVAGAFIALLELMRQGKLVAVQEEPFGEIWLAVQAWEAGQGQT